MSSTPTSGADTHGHHGRRLKKLLKPDGRRIHIAATPEEHVRLTRTLCNIEPDDNYDVYIHGSPEHLDAVRELHAHHEERRSDLRDRHGNVYDEFEHIKSELDILSGELHMLTEHAVSLDANFSKFGYSAHIRTREPSASASSTSLDTEKRDWDAERRKGEALKFWRRPVVRQYFHKGLLWRATEVEEVASFELFVDLLYVGIIAVVGDSAAEDATGYSLLKFAVTFILGWKMWSDLSLVISWFEVDDIFQRLCVLFVMIMLFGYTLNIVQAFESTWIQLIAFYLAQRLFLAVYYAWIAYLLPMVRGYLILNALCILVPAALWIASVQLELPYRLALIWPAIVLDLYGTVSVFAAKRWLESGSPDMTAKYQWFDFFPAINIEHKTERTNAFVTLVFGFSVVSLLFQNKAPYGINAFFGKAVLGLIQAFAFNWLYFEIDGWNLHTHAIRRHALSTFVWTSAHLPFIMGYVLAGASLSRLVLATDCRDANIDDLTDTYAAKSSPVLSPGLRWYYCGGLGIALLSMTLISLSHVHKEFDGQRLGKRARLPLRIAVAIVLLCLPLADGLSSRKLIGTTTGLVVFVLVIDVYGSTDKNDSFWRCKAPSCRYSAACPVRRAAIVDALKKGEVVNLGEIRGEGGLEKGFYEQL